jgi:nucleoside-diphosphate-sugar epimerase
METPRVLITGGGGFLGQAIVKLCLARGYHVRIMGRKQRSQDCPPEVDYFCGDLANRESVEKAMQGCHYVFHVAAQAGIWGRWEDYVKNNIIGTRYCLEVARATGIKAFVYTSTPSVVFTGEAFQGADESLPYGRNWLCAYAETKASAERDVLKSHTPEMPTCALRPHLIWGPGDHHIFPRILERARQGKLRIVGDGENKVDVTHVDSAAVAHLNALDALLAGRGHGKAYFISQGQPVKLWEFVNRLLSGAGLPHVTQKISLRRAYLLGAILEGIWTIFRLKGEPPMTRFVAVELAKDHWFDIRAAQQDLGFQPQHDTWQALDKLAQTFREKI